MQLGQQFGRHGVARFDRRRRLASHHQFVAEILDHCEACGAVGGKDRRRREAARAQAERHCDKWRHAFGQMRDCAIGLAIAHGRSIRSLRRIHQDISCEVAGEPLVAARRGIALDAAAFGLAESGAVQELADRQDALGARGKAAVTRDACPAHRRSLRGRQRQCDVEPVGRQEARGAVGPFQQRHGAVGHVLEAEFGELARPRQTVEIGMHQRKSRQLVGLHQREGRARHLDRGVAGELADERAGKCGLAGAEIAGQRDQVTGFDGCGDVHHQRYVAASLARSTVKL